MQEIFEKIIERPREEKLNIMLPDGFRDECITIRLLEIIVNQVAEEYRNNSVDVCTVFDILDQFHMFQGQRAGRELWSNKPEAVQNKDIENFNRNLQVIRNYVKSTAHINCLTDKLIELLSRAKGACDHKVCDEVMCAFKEMLEEYSNSEIPNMSDIECAWETDLNIISGMYKRNTGCGYTFYDVVHVEPFKFCPYCGKKINYYTGEEEQA